MSLTVYETREWPIRSINHCAALSNIKLSVKIPGLTIFLVKFGIKSNSIGIAVSAGKTTVLHLTVVCIPLLHYKSVISKLNSIFKIEAIT